MKQACIILFALLLNKLPVSNGSQPHIVFIVADDLGWNDVGFRNPQVISPNIDRLATAGVILNSSYVQSVCSPSRNCFMTGYFPYHTGLQDGVIWPYSRGYIPLNFTFLPERLQELGYTTHAVGKWHLGFCNWNHTPTRRGFDSFLGFYGGGQDYYKHTRRFNRNSVGYDFRFNETVLTSVKGRYSTHVFAERAVDIIESHDPSKPLYLYLPFQAVHGPLQVPAEYEMRNSHIRNKKRRIFSSMITAMDEAIGNITDALERTGLMDNLLLVFTTDNGGPRGISANNFPLRGAKKTLWEGGTKGTAFIYSKNLLNKTGYVNTGMLHAVDWYPTLLELAGGENTDPAMDGVSQYDMLVNGGESNRTEFVYNIFNKSNSSAIRYKDLKLIHVNPRTFSNWQTSPTASGYSRTININGETEPFPPYMLFNITEDPREQFDLSTEHPELVEMMKTRLEKWKETAVPPTNRGRYPRSNPKKYGGNWSPGWC